MSESMAVVYRSRTTYDFLALSTGLIYLSPFIGGILGTVIAGKVSDIIVREMSKRNGRLYEPKSRLILALPVTLTTVIGHMGFGWSVHDSWIVPTIFFGMYHSIMHWALRQPSHFASIATANTPERLLSHLTSARISSTA
jgi:hypothetical protein